MKSSAFAALALSAALVSAWSPAQAQTCPSAVYPCYTQHYALQCGAPEAQPGKMGAPRPEMCINATCQPTTRTPTPAGTACPDDGNACTSDTCDGSDNCVHPAVANGTACADDGNVCTSDICSGGACSHPNPTGGSVCGAACIAPGTCCSSADCAALNTTGGTGVCSGAGGSCSLSCSGGYTQCGSACIPSGTCCSSANCSGGQVCSGVGGSCGCPAGQYACGGTCIATATCCANPNNCPPPTSGTGTDVCSGTGGSCLLTCGSGLKQCGSGCNVCCTDTDCPGNAANNQHGVCGASGCALACNANYKVCGTTCIPSTQCCSDTDCVQSADPCHVSQGSCKTGACTYANNDGATCNADNNACTPNDACAGGKCVADTTHTVTCIAKDCQTNNGCNPSTGDCGYTPLADGTSCGNNGCSATAGTCTTGACSAAAKDCSTLNTDCLVGACDPSKPAGAACITTNKMNGTTCGTTNKCVNTPACSGGICGGAVMQCTPSGSCRVSMCDPLSGACSETVAATGTTCAASCQQNATCDDNGNCMGNAVPDGTPCDKDGCTVAAVCGSGMCTCVGAADFGSGPAPIVPDASATAPGDSKHKGGCSTVPGPSNDGASPFALLSLLALFGAVVATRRRARQ